MDTGVESQLLAPCMGGFVGEVGRVLVGTRLYVAAVCGRVVRGIFVCLRGD